MSFTVVAPPPPCLIPTPSLTASLATVEQALQTAHCTVGAVSRTPNRTVPAGKVIAFSPAAGTQLANGAPVAIIVSRGAPCIVPRVARGEALAVVEKELRKADCSVGPIVRTHSHVHRGRVVHLSPAAGTAGAPRAPVKIIVSAGPKK